MADSVEHLEDMLQTMRSYLRSEMSVSEPTSNSVAKIRVNVQNTAPPNGGFAEVVFVGVRIVVLHTGTKSVLEKLKNIVGGRYPIQELGESEKKTIIWYVNTWVEEDDDGSTHRVSKIEGDILFPGENANYEINMPLDCLPYISLKVDGVLSPGNLFKSAHILKNFDKWSKPIVTDFFRGLNNVDIHKSLKLVMANTPAFGPKTTLEETTNFRKTIAQAVENVAGCTGEIKQLWSKCKSLEMIAHLQNVILPYLQSVEKACTNVTGAVASGNLEEIRDSVKRFNLLLNDAKEVDQKTIALVSKSGIEPGEIGLRQA